MKKPMSILITVAFLSIMPLLPLAAQNIQTTLTVRFADGGEIEVTDWIFEYEYGTSDKPVTGFSFYTPSYHRTKDLMLVASKTERGVTYTDERVIPASQLKSIKFEYGNNNYLKKIAVQLSNGDIIEVEQLSPPKKLLTKANYIFEQKLYLKGKALVSNKKGEFSKRLYVIFNEDDIKERIVEITFGKR